MSTDQNKTWISKITVNGRVITFKLDTGAEVTAISEATWRTLGKPPLGAPNRWFNAEIRHLINRTRSLRRRIKSNPTNHLVSKLYHLESSLDQLILHAKLQYEQSLVNTFQSDPSKLYRYLKSLSKPSTSDYPISHNSKCITDPERKANVFNLYFNSVFLDSDFVLPPINELPTPVKQLGCITIDSSDVFTSLMALNSKKAPGIDNISPLILKLCADTLLIPITHLLNTCISSCSLPEEWKIHKIIPIPKCGKRSDVQNYRPISLLCILSKVLEKIIYEKIITFIGPLLSKNQFGFLPNRSCATQLLSSLSVITNADPCDVIFLDFRKAFDSIPHQELLFKLWSHGITGPLWSWFKAYLTGRFHLVSIEGCSSDLLPVRSGVPQGSILGPLLFLVYVNDIPNITTFSHTYLFADDTKLLQSISSTTDSFNLQQDLDSLTSWCDTWKLRLNTSKCVALRFSLSSTSLPTYIIDNQPIKSVTSHRDLGVVVNSSLSWSEHIHTICNKAYQSLHLIRRSINSTSTSLRLRLYISLVRSKLTHCSQIWRPHLIKDILCLERVQRRATKFICNDFAMDYKSRLISLHLLPLMTWLELQDIMFLVRCLKRSPDNLNITKVLSFVSSTTRAASNNKLCHNFSRLTIVHHFYYNRIVRLWNAIPTIDISQSYTSIKNKISAFLWDKFLVNFNTDNPCTLHYLCICSSCSQVPHY